MSFPTPPWANDLAGTLDQVWGRLERAVVDPKAGMRNVQYATVGPDGPAVRTVVPRAVRRGPGEVEVHSDACAAKVRDLRVDPRAALVGWDRAARLQVRMRMTVEVIVGDAGRWADLSDEARWNYGAVPAPGEVIEAPDAWDRPCDRAGFAALVGRVEEIDAVLLDPAGHRRALYRRSDGWAGAWLSP